MTNKIKMQNKKGGFVHIIIVIILALLLMNYFGLSVTGFFNWLAGLFRSVL